MFSTNLWSNIIRSRNIIGPKIGYKKSLDNKMFNYILTQKSYIQKMFCPKKCLLHIFWFKNIFGPKKCSVKKIPQSGNMQHPVCGTEHFFFL